MAAGAIQVARCGETDQPTRVMHATNLICTQRRQLATSTAPSPFRSGGVTGDRPALLHQTAELACAAVRDVFERTKDGTRP